MTQLIPGINSSDHIFGSPSARLELVEYGDYECPYCGRAYPIVKSILRNMGSEIKFVFRNFPLTKIHPHAFSAAVATEAAGWQDKFWEMHDIIFENQHQLDLENILLFANAIDLDMDRFKKDIQRKPLMEKVELDFDSGLRSAVNRTPTFFINGYKYEGDWTGDTLLLHLKGMLKKSFNFLGNNLYL
jgi:protein-disulfide isomerase